MAGVLLVCRNLDCSDYMTVSEDEEKVLVEEIIVGFAPETLSTCDFYKANGSPDAFFDWYLDNVATMFYNDYRLELVLTIDKQWVEYMWLRGHDEYWDAMKR